MPAITQDPTNEGPAYRIGEPGSGQQESGALEFAGWSEDREVEGYVLDAYFDGDGRYLGPDQHGVYPCFAVEVRSMTLYVDRITRNPETMGGKPAIRGMRITSRQVARMAASGMPTGDIVAEFPFLEESDVMASLIHEVAWALLPKGAATSARKILCDRLDRLAGATLVEVLRGLDLEMRSSGPGPNRGVGEDELP